MKTTSTRLSLIPGILLAMSFVNCNAQKIDAAKVPAAVKETFKKEFPKVQSVKWEIEDKNYEAGFKENGKEMSAVIDAKGMLLETETAIAAADLPPGAAQYIARHYKGAAVKEAAVIKKANGEIVYEAEINRKDVLFNKNGDFIKEEKD